ncbi:MAG: LysM peptidoglycan-binding domain-containing protein [Bernardetiaceae bacterium]|nr:LysM peptidoglycan-binding domain-containing protein [Bernardetiaceae bacterium]
MKNIAHLIAVWGLICFSISTVFSQENENPAFKVKKDDYPLLTEKKAVQKGDDTYLTVMANGLKAVIAQPQTELSVLAAAFDIELKRFLDFNDMETTDELKAGVAYYLEPKNDIAPIATYVLHPDESTWDVAHKFGISLRNLYRFNRMDRNEAPQAGRVLWLQTRRPRKVPIEIREVPSKKVEKRSNEALINIPTRKEEPTTDRNNPNKEEDEDDLRDEWADVLANDMKDLKKPENEKQENTNTRKRNTQPLDNKIDEPEETGEKHTDTGEPLVVATPQYVKSPPYLPEKYEYYTVKLEEETLIGIARANNVELEKFKLWNRIPDMELQVQKGQKFAIAEKINANTKAPKQNNNYADDDLAFGDSTQMPTPSNDERITRMATPHDLVKDMDERDFHIVQEGETLWSIAQQYGITMKQLTEWNGIADPDLIGINQRLALNKTFSTQSTAATYTKAKANTVYYDAAVGPDGKTYRPNTEDTTAADMDKNKQSVQNPGEHTVQKGENLIMIAQKYGVSYRNIMKWNNLNDEELSKLKEGQHLIVSQKFYDEITQVATEPRKNKAQNTENKMPATNDNKTTTAATDNKNNTKVIPPAHAAGAGFHIVQRDENIYQIANQYKISIANIRQWNNLDFDTYNFEAGTKLVVSEAALAAKPKTTKQENEVAKAENTTEDAPNEMQVVQGKLQHTVDSGETLSSIARKYKISIEQLRAWNNIEGDKILKGATLIVSE